MTRSAFAIGAPWNDGIGMLPADVDRIAPEWIIATNRYLVLENTGIRQWVDGAFTFSLPYPAAPGVQRARRRLADPVRRTSGF